MPLPSELKRLYAAGVNITQHLKNDLSLSVATPDVIELAYDLQAGSYVAAMRDPEFAKRKSAYSSEISRVISNLCQPESILEAGVGEATTLSGVAKAFKGKERILGCDISWSRIAYGRKWLREEGFDCCELVTGELLEMPYASNSVDVVYTSHSVEPNRGSEHDIIAELFRVARRYVVLLEPAYELADEAARARMELHGYCRNLREAASTAGGKVIRHELFSISINPLNPTAITVIEKAKAPEGTAGTEIYVCPKSRTLLNRLDGFYYSPESMLSYPVIRGIPCLRSKNAIVCSHMASL